MPIYEYKCESCDTITEEYEKSSHRLFKTTKCSSCGLDAKRIISAPQAYNQYTGPRRHEETVERSTAVTAQINTGTGERKILSEKPLKNVEPNWAQPPGMKE